MLATTAKPQDLIKHLPQRSSQAHASPQRSDPTLVTCIGQSHAPTPPLHFVDTDHRSDPFATLEPLDHPVVSAKLINSSSYPERNSLQPRYMARPSLRLPPRLGPRSQHNTLQIPMAWRARNHRYHRRHTPYQWPTEGDSRASKRV